jgi:hypothetical protein
LASLLSFFGNGFFWNEQPGRIALLASNAIAPAGRLVGGQNRLIATASEYLFALLSMSCRRRVANSYGVLA